MAVEVSILTRMFRSLTQSLIEFVYPPYCLLCNERLTPSEDRICTACWSRFIRISPGHPAWDDLENKFNNTVIDRAYTQFLFEPDGPLQNVLHHLKYNGYRKFGYRLGEEVGRDLQQEPEFRSADFLIPVPLHRTKYRERGYNQSEWVCRGISASLTIPVLPRIMKRTRYTVTQTKLNVHERTVNVAGAFSIPEKYRPTLSGKKVLLVDDVVTTGSTTLSCAHELKKMGVVSVFSVSVAHAY